MRVQGFAALLTMAIGWGLAAPVSRDRVTRLALAWPLGAGCLALLVLLLPGFTQPRPWTRIALSASCLVAAAVVAWTVVTRVGDRAPAPVTGGPPATTGLPGRVAWWLLLLLIVAEVGVLGLAIGVQPRLQDWDGWAIWGIKARAFTIDGRVDDYLAAWRWHAESWPARPCLSSLAAAGVGLAGGDLGEGDIRLLHLLWFASLTLLLYAALRRAVGDLAAMLYASAFALVPNVTYHAAAGAGNLPLACYLFATLEALDRWRLSGSRGHLLQATLAASFAALSRDEGLVFAAFVAALHVSRRSGHGLPDWKSRAATFAAVALPPLLVTLAWSVGPLSHGVWDLRGAWLEELPTRLRDYWPNGPAVLAMMWNEVSVPGRQMRASPLEVGLGITAFWPLVLLVLGVRLRAVVRHPLGGDAALFTLAGLATYTLGFWLFPYDDLHDLEYGWLFALDRHLVALAPAAACAVACALHVREAAP